MRAVLLAAGLGTRLRPITDTVPKCLVTIHGKPLLEYWLDLLFEADVERVLINTHYLADEVKGYVYRSKWANQIDLTHEEVLLGTGGTLLANREWIGNASLLVAHADNLTVFDPQDLFSHHLIRPKACSITMMTFLTDAPETCGIVEIEDEIVVRFHEKVNNPPSNNANAAVYIFEPDVIEFMQELGKKNIDISSEILPQFLGKIFTYKNETYHRDVGTIDSLQKAEIEFRN